MAAVLQEYFSKRVNQIPVFSLQNITLRRITTFLCKNQQLGYLIMECELDKFYCLTKDKKEKVEAEANEIISKIPAIGIYKEMLLDFLWPVAYRIILWKQLYASTVSKEFLHFYWTDQGRIDSKRTAKNLIANKMIPVVQRFKLACSFCLTEDMCKLWENMAVRCYYFEEHGENNISFAEVELIIALKGLSNNITERNLDKLLKYAIKIGSIEVVKCLFSIIPENMKSGKAIFCFDCISDKLQNAIFFQEEGSEIGFFIISQMNAVDKEVQFRFHSHVVLSILLYSSDRNMFLEAWNEGLNFCSIQDIEMVLFQIILIYHLEILRDLDDRMLFVWTWRLLPASVKDFIRTESYLGLFCLFTLLGEDFKFILQKGSSTNLANLIALNLKSYPSTIFLSFKQFKWNFLHFLIEEEIITLAMLEKKRGSVRLLQDRTQFLACVSLIYYICSKNEKRHR